MKKEDLPKSILSKGAGRFEVPYFGKVILPIPSNTDDFWKVLYDKATQEGIQKGKIQRSEEIKRLLNI
jgi:hypothetical protein